MMKKVFVYYIIGFIVVTATGFLITDREPFRGLIISIFVYFILVSIISIFFGVTGGDPREKSIYEIRKKPKESNSEEQ